MGADGCVYKMAAFHKQLSAGSTVDITLGTKAGKFFFVTIVPKVICRNSMTEAECTATHSVAGETSTCTFVGGLCLDRYCAAAAGSPSSSSAGTTPSNNNNDNSNNGNSNNGNSNNGNNAPVATCPAANS